MDFERARIMRAAERADKVIGGRCKFERGVKLITRERRLERAMPWFRKFLRERSASEKIYDAALTTAGATGFTSVQVITLRKAFGEWKPSQKSRSSSVSRAVGVAKQKKVKADKAKNDSNRPRKKR